MKNHLTLWIGLALAVLAAPGNSQAGVVNGSFESWNLLGWSHHSDVGTIETEPFTRTVGTAGTGSSWGAAFGLDPLVMPQNGHRFLRMNTRVNANFVGNGTYNNIVSQTLTLNQGDVLSGLSLLYTRDSEPVDSAWVRILDENGGLIGAPWLETSGTPSLLASPDWTLWQWAAPTTGDYTLQLGMTTSGANNGSSYGFFDGIAVNAIPVPEPTVMSLGLFGGLALLTLRKRVR